MSDVHTEMIIREGNFTRIVSVRSTSYDASANIPMLIAAISKDKNNFHK